MNKRGGAADEGMGEFLIGLALIVAAILLVLFVGVTETENTKDLSESLVTEANLRRQFNQVLLSPVEDVNPEISNVYDIIVRLPYFNFEEKLRYEEIIQEKVNIFFNSRSIPCGRVTITNEKDYEKPIRSKNPGKKVNCAKTVELTDIRLVDINNAPIKVEVAND